MINTLNNIKSKKDYEMKDYFLDLFYAHVYMKYEEMFLRKGLKKYLS